jgi:acetylornithine deacetylase/succinyl-diaminopimelate desuccinylase-like protein
VPVGRPTDTLELVSSLVGLESVNPALDPAGAGEAEIARFLRLWLNENGIETTIDEPRPGRPNVIGRIRGSGDGPTLLLTGHLDTVSLGGEWAGTAARVDGDKLFGRGAYDMKGGIAAILLAARELRGVGLAGDVVIAAVADEEHHSIGTTSLIERLYADAAVVAEPTDFELVIAHKGFAWFTVEIGGRAAHGSRPEEGIDAIVATAPILGRIGALSRRLAASPAHSLLGTGSVHASTVAGGTDLSTYPASCSLTLERRTIPGETGTELDDELTELVAGVERAEWQRVLLRNPFEVDVEQPIVASLRRHAGAVGACEPPLAGRAYWTDAALFAAAGVPTVVFGPGGAGAHAEREWVSLSDVRRCAEALTYVAIDVCGLR